MKATFNLALLVLLAGTFAANAQETPDPRMNDLVHAGKLRAALFLPQFTQNPQTGEIRGDVHLVELARALASRIGVELVLVDYPTPTAAVRGLNSGSCDVAFLGIDQSRAAEVAFSPPFVELDYTYLVPPGSSIRNIADADRPGIRIAAVSNHASTLALKRILKQATLASNRARRLARSPCRPTGIVLDGGP